MCRAEIATFHWHGDDTTLATLSHFPKHRACINRNRQEVRADRDDLNGVGIDGRGLVGNQILIKSLKVFGVDRPEYID